MPTYTFSINEINRMLNDKPTTTEELNRILPTIAVPVEDYDENSISIEVYANRPDLLGVEGLARIFAGITKRQTGLQEYHIEGKTHFNAFVDEEMKEYRPFLCMARVTDLKLNEESVQAIFTFQEKLHTTHARNRKKASIGLYDITAGKLESPITMRMVNANELKFIPLDEKIEMTPGEMLKNTIKGRTYANLVAHDKMPALLDKNKQILSIIPVLNSDNSRVTTKTTDIFVDTTGTDYATTLSTFNMIITALADRGGVIHPATIHYKYDTPDGRKVDLPNFSVSKFLVKPSYINKKLGKLIPTAIQIECLEQNRLGVKQLKEDLLEISVPCFRTDILHPIDFVEEVAIAYGYSNFTPTIPDVTTIGEESKWQILKRRLAHLYAGVGAYEVMTYNLSSEKKCFTKMNLPVNYDDTVVLANPMTTLTTICRNWLLPSLMEILNVSKTSSFPQQLFEMAIVTHIDSKTETGTRDDWNFCYVESSATSNFNNSRAALKTLEVNLGIKFTLLAADNISYLTPGRAAKILFNNTIIGFIGEIHPQILVNWDLELPAVCFELEVAPWFIQIRKDLGYD